MKKLVTSIMATAMILGVSSCGDHDFEAPVSYNQQVQDNFDRAFVEAFGHVYPDQDWGFGDGTETKAALTRGVNANANQWFTGEGGATPVYEIDPNVKVAEKNAVFAYVNQDRSNLKVVSQPNWTDFFVTQVWKGNADSYNGQTTPKSTSYPDQNGATTTIAGAGNMDQLETQLANGSWEHINNFNNSNNGNSVTDVNGNDIVGKMLMVGSGTTSFRYNNSQSSYQSQKYIVVKGSDVPGMPTECYDYYYVCFDFENGYTDAEKAAEKTSVYLKCAYTIDVPAFDGNKTITITNADHWGVTEEWIAQNYTGKWGADMSDWTINLTCTDGHIWNGTITYPEKTDAYSYSENISQNVILNGYYEASSFSSIKDVVRAYKNLPADATITITSDANNTSYNFVGYQNGDKHFDGDNVYTDWIVRISPAIVKGESGSTPVDDGTVTTRVFVEDLFATSSTYLAKSDWDFNDVVFDVVYHPANGSTAQYSEVILQAAGGTLELKLFCRDQEREVHDAFGVPTTTMVNTSPVTIDPVPIFTFPGEKVTASEVEVRVNHGEGKGWVTITAFKGEPAAKFAAKLTNKNASYKWPGERVHIENVFPNYTKWATTGETLQVIEDLK